MARQLFDGVPDRQFDQNSVKHDPAFEARRAHLVQIQRRERDALSKDQEQRRAFETKARQASIPRGLKAVWAKLSGSYARLIINIERAANVTARRDRAEQQSLIERHLTARRVLDRQFGIEMRRDLAAVFVEATRADPRQRLRLPKETQPFSSAQLISDPALILSHLSRQQATFSVTAIKRALDAMIDDPLELRRAIDTVLASQELVRLADETYTTRDYQQSVQTLDAATWSLARKGSFAVADRYIDAAVGQQNAQLHARFGSELSDEQRAAVGHILGDSRFTCVVGLAGSGKSTMLSTAHAAWARQGLRVHGAALSGKAAEGLQSASGIESRTLASLEHSWQNGYEPIAAGDVLVIDEAGMIGTRQLMGSVINSVYLDRPMRFSDTVTH